MNNFVICSQCIYWEECENKENHDGCYFGEINEVFSRGGVTYKDLDG